MKVIQFSLLPVITAAAAELNPVELNSFRIQVEAGGLYANVAKSENESEKIKNKK